jgi:hypothetical protein
MLATCAVGCSERCGQVQSALGGGVHKAVPKVLTLRKLRHSVPFALAVDSWEAVDWCCWLPSALHVI